DKLTILASYSAKGEYGSFLEVLINSSKILIKTLTFQEALDYGLSQHLSFNIDLIASKLKTMTSDERSNRTVEISDPDWLLLRGRISVAALIEKYEDLEFMISIYNKVEGSDLQFLNNDL